MTWESALINVLPNTYDLVLLRGRFYVDYAVDFIGLAEPFQVGSSVCVIFIVFFDREHI
jgi:hypothetical protein